MKMRNTSKTEIDIEDLVHWAYDRQKAQYADRTVGDYCGPRFVSNNWNAFARLLELGHLGDGGAGSEMSQNKVHEDALMVHGAVLRLPPQAFHLVYTHGLAGTRPDWYPHGVGAYQFTLDGRGRKKPIYRDQANRNEVIGYKQVFVGDRPEVVEHGRAEYAVWVEALAVLCRELSDRLDEHCPLLPVCDSEPWHTLCAVNVA